MSALAPDSAFAAAHASQALFRAVMDAFARPGEIKTVSGVAAPSPLSPGSAALLTCFADFETPIWLAPAFAGAGVTDWIRFHTGARLTPAPDDATFALVDGRDLPDFSALAQGSEEYPDRSTTLIVQVERFAGAAFTLKGPGIKGARTLAASPLPADFAARLAANRKLYPRGVDLVLVAGEQVAALPRSLRVAQGGQ
jgi:alpha-D-ribose 1-methylphosphonate 5-triphosphate synthase subunit PhnH